MSLEPRPRWTGRQLHNQPEDSHQHRFLVDLWTSVARETNGNLVIEVLPRLGDLPGSDPQATQFLVDGGIEFLTQMGPLLAHVVPAMEIQGAPFAFSSHAEVHRVLDGLLGDHLRAELRAKGLVGFQGGLFENGFRHIISVERTVRSPDDLAGYRMRVPAGRIYADLFRAYGAVPVTVNIRELHTALGEGRVDGHENPLAIVEFNALHDVTRHIALTAHAWSGFNLVANAAFWQRLPQDVQTIVERHIRRVAAEQRAFTDAMNEALVGRLSSHGITVDTVDRASFRDGVPAEIYRDLRERVGAAAWRLFADGIGWPA